MQRERPYARGSRPYFKSRFVPGEAQVVCGRDSNSGKAFTYDYVFPIDSGQSEIYDQCVVPLIEQCFDGFNATILAYGQTGFILVVKKGSGKTYTMGSAVIEGLEEEQQGIIPRVISKIFQKVEFLNTNQHKEYNLRVSFLELYNEDIKDMFSPEHPPTNFQIRF